MEEIRIEHKETGGGGALLFAMIPAALGGAALMWLAFYTGIIQFQNEQRVAKKADTLAQRMDNRVGVKEPLQNPVKLVIRNKSCVIVNRAFIDENQLTMYVHNGCHGVLGYYEWHWQAISPDGTIIDSGYQNDGSGFDAGATAEKKFDLPNDDRISKVVVFATNIP